MSIATHDFHHHILILNQFIGKFNVRIMSGTPHFAFGTNKAGL